MLRRNIVCGTGNIGYGGFFSGCAVVALAASKRNTLPLKNLLTILVAFIFSAPVSGMKNAAAGSAVQPPLECKHVPSRRSAPRLRGRRRIRLPRRARLVTALVPPECRRFPDRPRSFASAWYPLSTSDRLRCPVQRRQRKINDVECRYRRRSVHAAGDAVRKLGCDAR